MFGIEKDENGDSTEGIAEIIVGKQRNGPTGKARLAFMKQYARFENLLRQREEAFLPPGRVDETPF
jgi:replicative DNA helicase